MQAFGTRHSLLIMIGVSGWKCQLENPVSFDVSVKMAVPLVALLLLLASRSSAEAETVDQDL